MRDRTIAFLVRKRSNGEIVRTGYCSLRDLKVQAGTGEVARENTGNYNDKDHYYKAGKYLSRPEMDLSISNQNISVGDIFRINGIPPGTTVKTKSSSTIVDDSFCELTSYITGGFTVSLENFPYIRRHFYVNFTAD